jgi:uridine phosphorylase
MYRETKDMVEYRRSEGCQSVDMECASLASVARFRKKKFGQILFTADSLANAKKYDARNWGEDSHEMVLSLCMEAIADM